MRKNFSNSEPIRVVTTCIPAVGYAYDPGSGTTNEIRLNTLIHPNLRNITYSYGTSGGMNGPGTVVRITYPQPGVWLDLWGGTSGVFAGLGLFSRIIDQRWQNNITGTPVDIDRYKYGRAKTLQGRYEASIRLGDPVARSGGDLSNPICALVSLRSVQDTAPADEADAG